MSELRQPNEAWHQQQSTSKRYEIAKVLAELSIRRQADVSKETYAVFAEDLMPFPIDDVRQACKNIGSTPRQQGEKAFPEVGTIIAECERVGRMRRTNSDRRAKCPYCCDGMTFVVNALGQSIAIEACRECSGPAWLESSRQHNQYLPKHGGA